MLRAGCRCHLHDHDLFWPGSQCLANFELSLFGSSAPLLRSCAPSAGGDFFSKFAFAGVLIDEAAQATELAAIVPLILRGVGNCA